MLATNFVKAKLATKKPYEICKVVCTVVLLNIFYRVIDHGGGAATGAFVYSYGCPAHGGRKSVLCAVFNEYLMKWGRCNLEITFGSSTLAWYLHTGMLAIIGKKMY